MPGFVVYGRILQPTAEAGLISKDQEISMGRDVAKELEKKYGLVDDAQLQERIQNRHESGESIGTARSSVYCLRF